MLHINKKQQQTNKNVELTMGHFCLHLGRFVVCVCVCVWGGGGGTMPFRAFRLVYTVKELDSMHGKRFKKQFGRTTEYFCEKKSYFRVRVKVLVSESFCFTFQENKIKEKKIDNLRNWGHYKYMNWRADIVPHAHCSLFNGHSVAALCFILT